MTRRTNRRHQTGRTTAPGDDEIVSSEVWFPLWRFLSSGSVVNSPTFANAFTDHCLEFQFFRCGQDRLSRSSFENLCHRVVLKPGRVVCGVDCRSLRLNRNRGNESDDENGDKAVSSKRAVLQSHTTKQTPLVVGPQIIVRVAPGIRPAGLLGTGIHREQSAFQPEVNLSRTETEHWQGDSLCAFSPKNYWKIVNLSSQRICHDHHQAGTSAAPLDDRIMSGEIRPCLLLTVTEDTPALSHAFPDSCTVHMMRRFLDDRVCGLPFENLCHRVVLKPGRWGTRTLCPRRQREKKYQAEDRSSRHCPCRDCLPETKSSWRNRFASQTK